MRIKSVAGDMNIKLNMGRDSRLIIENSLSSSEQNVEVNRQTIESASNISKSTGNSFSSKPKLGQLLNDSDKENVLQLYESLVESKMWKLSTGKYVERGMYNTVKTFNYEQ
jgi:hypothetical protein